MTDGTSESRSSAPVAITAAEMLVPCGVGARAVLEAATAGAPLEIVREITAFEVPEDAPPYGCPIDSFQITDYVDSIKTYIDRTSALALAGAGGTLEAAGLREAAARRCEVGLAYATAWGCLDSMALFFGKVKGGKAKFAPPLPFSHAFPNSPASLLAIEFALRGHSTVHSAGWTSAAQAIGSSADAVARGAVGAILAGGSEALSAPLHAHHDLRGELSPTGTLAPGSEQADGLVLGEGAAFVVLETAARREPLAILAGWGAASGPASEPPADRAAALALDASGLSPRQVDLVLTAGCGLPELDLVELERLRAWAGQVGAAPAALPAQALTGALSGASAAFATALAAQLLAARTPLESLRFAPAEPLAGKIPSGPADAILVSSIDPGGAAVALLIAAA